MNLRSTLWAVAAVMVGGTMGCGEQPKYYRVAIDRAPLDNLPASCYRSGTPPTEKTNNVVDVAQWVLWDGVEDRQYLQVGDINYSLGDASVRITTGDAIVSSEVDKKTTFTVERTQTDPARTTRVTYTLDKESMGTLEGTLSLSYSCTGTTGCAPNCDASLHFVGRQVDADSMIVVSNTAG
ncbi:hypothetical protein [Archangium sp.]|uniref:hypothetical protein n=1 Tax=Archangium sp. TaxID=1872627 RepID=UPI00389984D9